MELDRVPLWRGDHVSIKQIVEDFARYLYLPRVSDSTVLLNAISDGIALLTWKQDAYAFADSFDDEAKRYRGFTWRASHFITGCGCSLDCSSSRTSRGDSWMPRDHRRLAAEKSAGGGTGGEGPDPGGGSGPGGGPSDQPPAPQPKRFHGTATLDAERVGPRREPDCGRGDRASFRPSGSQGYCDPRDRSRGAGGRPGSRRAHGNGEQSDTKVHEPGL